MATKDNKHNQNKITNHNLSSKTNEIITNFKKKKKKKKRFVPYRLHAVSNG